ncbi:hypothetical protein [Streptomyces sp. NPDC059906]|uniref:hypothetical protein n=1 Tax=Streptomyces sp. NPDC059906 TaxID=3346997 RepID=UPI003665C557
MAVSYSARNRSPVGVAGAFLLSSAVRTTNWVAVGGSGGSLKGVWLALSLMCAVIVGAVMAGIFWAIGHRRETADRATGAPVAGGAAFLGMATLGIRWAAF